MAASPPKQQAGARETRWPGRTGPAQTFLLTLIEAVTGTVRPSVVLQTTK
jgi:hypothetical protein